MVRMLSKFLSYDRAIYSANAVARRVSNIPDDRQLKALILMGSEIYDKVVEKFGMVFPSSVFRNDRVNQLAGGSSTSGHIKGECIDLDGDNPSNYWARVDNSELFLWCKNNLKYDQLIAEYQADGKPKWVHIGFRATGNRQQTLIATKNSVGNTVYMLYSDKLYNKIYRTGRAISLDFEEFEMPATDFQTQQDEAIDEDFLFEETMGNRDYVDSFLPNEKTEEIPFVATGSSDAALGNTIGNVAKVRVGELDITIIVNHIGITAIEDVKT